MDNKIYGFMAGAVVSGLLVGALVSYNSDQPPQKPAVQQPAGHRYLQKCGDDVTVEYRSLRKLPKGAVCGE